MKCDFSKILNIVLKFIYPNHCMFCTELIPIENEEEFVCESCGKKVIPTAKPRCDTCDRPINIVATCRLCKENKQYFDRGYTVYKYDGEIRRAILKFKFKNMRRYRKPFGEAMTKYFVHEGGEKPDYIVPVPLHIRRHKHRGYNQAELLAEEVAREIDTEIAPALIRVKNTKAQSSLGWSERKDNIKNAFALNEKIDVRDKSILLIDDIFTTGSTCNECARVLKKHKAKSVRFLTLAAVVSEDYKDR